MLALALSLALAPGPGAAAAGRVERIGAFAGAAPDGVKQSLQAQGYRIALSDGTVAAELWFRKDLPGLKPGNLVGVITVPKDTNDFRGQALKAGSYTLRYAQMPSDGNHLGAAPTTDFLLLLPPSADAKPADDLTFEEVTKTSAKVSGTNHPAPLNLADASGQKEFPAVATDDYGHEVFFVKLTTSGGGELPIGIVVKGQTEH